MGKLAGMWSRVEICFHEFRYSVNAVPVARYLSGFFYTSSSGGRRRLWIEACIVCAVVLCAVFSIYLVVRAHSLHHGYFSVFYDSSFYFSIARHGIEFSGFILHKQNAAFLPGYSLLLAPAANLWPHDPFLAVSTTSLILSFIGGVLLYVLVARDLGILVARTSLVVLFTSPFAIYFFNGYSGPAFFACGAAVLYLLRGRYWALASFLAGYAAVCRPHGIVFVALVPLAAVCQIDRRRLIPMLVRCAFWGMLPALAYSLYVYIKYGDSMLYVNALEAWRAGNATDGTQGIVGSFHYYLWLISHDQMRAVEWASLLYALYMSVFGLLGLRYLKADFAFTIVGLLVFELLSTHFNPANVGRHIAMIFPASVAMASIFCHPRHKDNHKTARNLLTKFSPEIAFLVLIVIQLGWFCANTMRYFNLEWVS